MNKTKSEPKTTHKFPVGAVVHFRHGPRRARMIVVQHSQDCDKSPLYMIASNPIGVPLGLSLYSVGYLVYRLRAGWFLGNVPGNMLRDTGERVHVEEFADTQEAKILAPILAKSVYELDPPSPKTAAGLITFREVTEARGEDGLTAKFTGVYQLEGDIGHIAPGDIICGSSTDPKVSGKRFLVFKGLEGKLWASLSTEPAPF